MKTKNIQQFRTSWRNEEGYNMSDWDENYIGSVHNGKMFGFYRMVNGIVENIKADLTPKLQNAQDEQAIYEFLQNAADSKSTECAIIYDENYFMVLNNGSPFTEKDLKALLNSFQGTKSDKSKPENCGKIGRYGIGFKLAYRLMGKSDGADELINHLAGPMLFSWKNSDEFKSLLNYKTGDFAQFESGDTWLLKIILTCFPVGLNEIAKDLEYKENILFAENELIDLVDFMTKHRSKIDRLNLEQGSMFFLKFGPKKHEKLKESLLNVQSGIGYSMNTLKTLEKVILQDSVVEKYDVEFEQITVLPGTEDFLRIDPEFPNCPIEISLGFPRKSEQMSLLRKSPSIYQFFPMRNERHSMAYFIHATSFSKITDRTRLDDQGEANIESLKYISKTLKKNLNRYKTDNFEKFALIYQSLLLSDKSDEYDADLINSHLYNQMLEYIRTTIPTNKKNLYLKDLVVIKDSILSIDPMQLGIGKEWFLWCDPVRDKEIMNEAANNAKLGLRRWGLKELLTEGNNDLIDNWLTEMSSDEYNKFVQELKNIDFDKQFIEKFLFLKCFRFTDNKSRDILLSIRDLQSQENVFLINDRTAPLKELIKELGFAVLEFDVREYANIFHHLEKQLDYLTNDRALFQKLAKPCRQANLKANQKHLLFDFLSHLNGVKLEDLRDLALFSNGYGLIVPMKSLLPANIHTESWLEDFKINKEEYSEKINSFLCNYNNWELYENIIAPEWHNLVKHSTLNNVDTVCSFYEKITELYKTKPGLSKPIDNHIVYVNDEQGFVESNKVLYFRNINEIQDYQSLASATNKIFDLYIPEQSVFKFFNSDPFRLLPVTVSKEWRNLTSKMYLNCKEADLSDNEKKALFLLLKLLLSQDDLKKIELFENNANQKTSLNKLISSNHELEPWLVPYQIKDTENSELLMPYMSDLSDLYNNIFCEKWDELTQDTSVLSNVEAFYQSVEKYFYLTKLPKTISSGKTIYVDENTGFVNVQQICYHPAMENFEQYKDLRKAIFLLTGQHTADASLLPFLNRKPLKIKENSLLNSLKNEPVVLNREELQALILFMDLTREDFFKNLIVTENENAKGYVVMKKGKSVPIYLEKSQTKLADKIKEVFGDTYKPLPYKLYNPNLRNEGLIMGTALFNQLSRSGELSPDFLSILITESENTELKEMVFSKISKIVLKQSMIYDKDSFEHQILQIFRSKDADYDKVRNKIYIEDLAGNIYKLTDIAFESTVTISIEREGKYQLNLSEVLPFFTDLQIVLGEILDKFIDYEAPVILKKRCFEVAEMSLNQVFNELKNNYKTLLNASQLAFLALYTKLEGKSNLLKEFTVLNINNQEIHLISNTCLHLQKNIFIDENAILHDSYTDVVKILKLQDKRAFFEFSGHKIAIEPYFDKNSFHCYPVFQYENQSDVQNLQELIIDFCYKKWKSNEELMGDFQIYTGDYPILSKLDALIFPDKYALDSETIPAWLENWLGDEVNKIDFDCEDETSEREVEDSVNQEMNSFERNKINFLVKLGLNAPGSKLLRLRRYLSEHKGSTVSQKLLNDIYNTNPDLLVNTVFWLLQNEAEFSSEDDRIHWLRKLYNTLEELPENLPLPYVASIDYSNHIIYKLSSNLRYSLAYFDNKLQQVLVEKYEISLNQLFNTLSQNEIIFTNLSLKNLEMLNGSIEEFLDVDYLVQESKEWASSHYLKWREEVPFKVFVFKGKIPYQLKLFGKTIKILKSGNAIVFEKMVFVNGNHGNMEEALFEIANRNNLTELMLLQLLRYKNESEVNSGLPPVIERVVEKVYVPEIISEDEELLENPADSLIMDLKQTGAKGQIKMSFNIEELSEETLEYLLKVSISNRLIISRKESDKNAGNE